MQHTTRQKDLRTSSLLSPNAYVCLFSVHPLQDTVWKNWRPLVTMMQLSDGRVAEYINIFDKNLGEGTAAFPVHFLVEFAYDGSRGAQILS